MSLDRSDWLPRAKRLYIGQTDRVYHGAEKRPNLVISNKHDRYVAYCQKCKEGGMVRKSHVPIKPPEPQERFMPWPADATPLHQCPLQDQLMVMNLIIGRGVDLTVVCPDVPVMFSREQQRIIFGTALGWQGRASAGQQPKWCNYGTGLGYGIHPYRSFDEQPRTVVLSEDLLSAFKIGWALGPAVLSVACLGTLMRRSLLSALVHAKPALVVGMWDGDRAGQKAAHAASQRLRGLGIQYKTAQVPDGLDPKDMDRADILKLYEEVYHRTPNSTGVTGAS